MWSLLTAKICILAQKLVEATWKSQPRRAGIGSKIISDRVRKLGTSHLGTPFSNLHEFELHRPSSKGAKLLLKVIKAIINQLSAVPIDDRIVYLSEILDAQNDWHRNHEKCVHLIVCLAGKLFLRNEGKVASCMHRDEEHSEQLGPIIVSLCKFCNCLHEETPTHSNHNIYWRQDDDVVDICDCPQSTTGLPPAFTDRYNYETSKILQIKILEFAELMVYLKT